MFTMQEIKSHYLFTDEDAEQLKSLLPIAEADKEQLIEEFYDHLLGIPETAQFLQDDQRLYRLKKNHADCCR